MPAVAVASPFLRLPSPPPCLAAVGAMGEIERAVDAAMAYGPGGLLSYPGGPTQRGAVRKVRLRRCSSGRRRSRPGVRAHGRALRPRSPHCTCTHIARRARVAEAYRLEALPGQRRRGSGVLLPSNSRRVVSSRQHARAGRHARTPGTLVRLSSHRLPWHMCRRAGVRWGALRDAAARELRGRLFSRFPLLARRSPSAAR